MLTERYQETLTKDQQYIIRNNVWGEAAGNSQTIEPRERGFKVIATDLRPESPCPVSSFPSIVKGCHPWVDPKTGDLLLTKGWEFHQVQEIDTLTTRLEIAGTTAPGKWSVIYDIWLDKTLGFPSGPSKDAVELLIFLRNRPKSCPHIGSASLQERIDGAWQEQFYDLHLNSTWGKWKHYIAYVRNEQTNLVELNLKHVLDDCLNRQLFTNDYFLASIEAGFEIGTGGVGLEVVDFNVDLKLKA